MHSVTSYVCASKFSLCAVHVNVSHVYTEYIGGGGNQCLSSPIFLLTYEYYESQDLQAGWKVWASNTGRDHKEHHTLCHKKKACFATLILAGRLLRETSFGSEWKKVKKTIQVREGKTTHTRTHRNSKVTEKREISICIRSEAWELIDAGKLIIHTEPRNV